MRSGDRDRLLQAHQFGQHFRPSDNGQQPFPGRFQLGIVALDGGGNDDDLGLAEIGRVVPDRDLHALLTQPQNVSVFSDIRALDGIAEIDQDLGDAAHADAADADEMHRPDVAWKLHATPGFPLPANGLPRARPGPQAFPPHPAGRHCGRPEMPPKDGRDAP